MFFHEYLVVAYTATTVIKENVSFVRQEENVRDSNQIRLLTIRSEEGRPLLEACGAPQIFVLNRHVQQSLASGCHTIMIHACMETVAMYRILAVIIYIRCPLRFSTFVQAMSNSFETSTVMLETWYRDLSKDIESKQPPCLKLTLIF